MAASVTGNDGAAAATIGPIAAPLFFVSPNQIDFQMLWEFVGQSQVSVTVTAFGVTSAPVTISLANPSQHHDVRGARGEHSRRPSAAGDGWKLPRHLLYGVGDVSNRPGDGAASPSSPLAQTVVAPTVAIGGVDAPVSFPGLTPGFAGLYQVNVQVPTGVPAGDAVPVIITIGGVKSNTVTIAVQ